MVRATAWIAFGFYVLSQVALRGPSVGSGRRAWWLSAAGWVVLVVHFGMAFHFRYGWSQEAAVVDTARQTAAMTGFNSGVGVFVNYAFGMLWLVDLVVSGRGKVGGMGSMGSMGRMGSMGGMKNWVWFVRAVFLFMFVNAAVIFVASAMKWVGVFGCLVLVGAWFISRKS
ncbi:MAG TPA: hypothetical protein VF773_03820 [Verrucomicrobiae bacterium]